VSRYVVDFLLDATYPRCVAGRIAHTTANPRSELQRFVSTAFARELVVRVSELLAPAGIVPMPLKGVLFQAWLYDDASERELVDADVLVPRGRFAEAARLLEAAGFVPRPQRMSHERSFENPAIPLPVDLHAHLFPRLRYSLGVDALFARAALDSDLFGCPVYRPDPMDALAHLIGHTTNNHADERTLGKYVRDVELLCARVALDPSDLADHLHRAGLGRATRYALPLLAEPSTADFVDAVLRQLPPDPLGAALARGARRVIASGAPGARRGTVAAYLLSQSVGHAVLAAGAAALDQRWHATA